MLDHKQHPARIKLDPGQTQDTGDIKANLGNATFIMSHLIQKPQGNNAQQNQETAQNAQNPQPPTNQTTQTDTNAQISGLETRFMDEIGTVKQMIEKAMPQDSTKVLHDLKDQIDSALTSE